MPPRKIAVVGCGFPQLGLLRAARDLGLSILGLDLNPEAVGVPLVDRFEQVSTGDPKAIEAALVRTGVRAITTTGSELALTSTAQVAHRLGLPFYAPPEVILRCQDKGAMRAAYLAAGLPVPRFLHARSLDEARNFAETVGPPLVVKPAFGWGQRGVSRVEDLAALEEAYKAAAEASHGHAGVIVEEFLPGHEISVNGWVDQGNLEVHGVTDREVFPGLRPLGVMRSEIAPSCLDTVLVEEGIKAARRAARALGLTRGPCYTQVCVAPGRAVVFETAARCGGGFDADVTRLVSGVDLYRRLLGVALGDPELEHEGARSERYGAALVRFLKPPCGEVRRVEGLEQARSAPGVVDAAIYGRPGQRLAGFEHAASRVGHLLCVGDSRKQAVKRADAAEAMLRIEVLEADPKGSGENLGPEGKAPRSFPIHVDEYLAPGVDRLRLDDSTTTSVDLIPAEMCTIIERGGEGKLFRQGEIPQDHHIELTIGEVGVRGDQHATTEVASVSDGCVESRALKKHAAVDVHPYRLVAVSQGRSQGSQEESRFPAKPLRTFVDKLIGKATDTETGNVEEGPNRRCSLSVHNP
ncbi:MAG: ATP-grasp domain-containing protein [Myxococcales bacterium]|nr:ATP-grasp domain-containing protein [Polyangiaceae bacterium]MDW8248881.1 ATP-grasp domain-containing protein [Myxococcales bacterium]